MRVLVATTAGAGHLGPLVPFARALLDAGHEVAVAAPGSFASSVERAGFAHLAFPDANPEDLGRVFATLPGLSWEDANRVVMRDVFGRFAAQAALPGMREIVASWRPDLVLRELTEYSSCAVAAEAGVPFATVAIGLSLFAGIFAPEMEAPLEELGMGGGMARLEAAPSVSLLPLSFEDPGAPGPPSMRRFQDRGAAAAGAARTDPLPDWWGGSANPLVYVTFGSVAAAMGMFPSLYQAVVAAVADLPVRVLLTTGDGGDVEALGALPANVHAERWWPQQHVMAQASAMVGHGGFGTTLAGLVAGMPMVVMPLFADQPHNAKRVAAVGAGIALEGGLAAVGEMGAAIARVLGEGSFREGAGRIAADIAALAPVANAVAFLEEVAGS